MSKKLEVGSIVRGPIWPNEDFKIIAVWDGLARAQSTQNPHITSVERIEDWTLVK